MLLSLALGTNELVNLATSWLSLQASVGALTQWDFSTSSTSFPLGSLLQSSPLLCDTGLTGLRTPVAFLGFSSLSRYVLWYIDLDPSTFFWPFMAFSHYLSYWQCRMSPSLWQQLRYTRWVSTLPSSWPLPSVTITAPSSTELLVLNDDDDLSLHFSRYIISGSSVCWYYWISSFITLCLVSYLLTSWFDTNLTSIFFEGNIKSSYLVRRWSHKQDVEMQDELTKALLDIHFVHLSKRLVCLCHLIRCPVTSSQCSLMLPKWRGRWPNRMGIPGLCLSIQTYWKL